MTATTFSELLRMRELIDKLPDIQWEGEKALARATQITANITGMPRGGGGNHQESANIAYAAAVESYHGALDELEAYRKRLAPLIDRLDDINDQGCMRMRYIHGLRIKEIAVTLNYADTSVYYHLNRGEREVVRMKETL